MKRIGFLLILSAVCLSVVLIRLRTSQRPAAAALTNASLVVGAPGPTQAAAAPQPPATNASQAPPAAGFRPFDRDVVGIGAHIFGPEAEGESFQIRGVIPGSPAQKAGLKPPLNIYKVDGKPLKGLSLQEVTGLIRGPVGTRVQLELSAPEDENAFTTEITREKLDLTRPPVER